MISAEEARALTWSFDPVAQELKMIEKQIKIEAAKGKFFTWWYPDGRIEQYSYRTLKMRLVEAGYYVSIEYDIVDRFYIGWHLTTS